MSERKRVALVGLALGVTVVLTALTGGVAAAAPAGTTRPADCAGNWYPADPGVLAKEVDRLLEQASPPRIEGKPVAVISPHAGYRYSAPVAAAGYRCLRGHTYRRVIVMAFSHRYAGSYDGVDVPRDLSAYQTPLGPVPIDHEAVARLLNRGGVFAAHPDVDRGEHSLELQLPLLQRVLGEFRLVPLLVGRMSDRAYTEAAEALVPLVDAETLLVASSDFTHFGPQFAYEPFKDDVANKLQELGDKAAAPILACDFDGFAAHLAKTDDTICGRNPIMLLLRVLSAQGGAAGVRAAFDTSGHLTGDWTNTVTYESLVLARRRGTLDEPARRELLRLARETVASFLRDGKVPEVKPETLPAPLRADGACFVTLENRGQLRGCIGNMTADGPLYRSVVRNAVNACQDSRFVGNPVTARELDQLHIEISYLTPMKRVKNTDEIIVGRHGLLIGTGNRHGVLLPQVAYEHGWRREEFLAQTCGKAGLPRDAWKRPEAEIYCFEAEVFGEPEPAATQAAGGH